ncbi:proline-rich protein DC2.15 [Zea mays]|uniref:Proline-rich protein DC2.15 n=1 Tax=Zea mays TaxID=4577 RepID=A0A3L6DFR0_MAIZE|nr:proline-rich protein DC2.15 [Zea mays]
MEASSKKLQAFILTLLLVLSTAVTPILSLSVPDDEVACDCDKPKAPKPSHPPKTKPSHPSPSPKPKNPSHPRQQHRLGACVDLLGGLVHIGLGDPVVNKCCPVLEGLVELEAAVCLCTTIKLRLLNINLYLPLALQLLLTCGKTPPPGYTCTV